MQQDTPRGNRFGCETDGSGEGEGRPPAPVACSRERRTHDARADITFTEIVHAARARKRAKCITPHYPQIKYFFSKWDCENEVTAKNIVLCSITREISSECRRRLWEFFSLFDTHMTWITVWVRRSIDSLKPNKC